LAIVITSSIEENGITDITGPKISSRAIVASFVTSAKMVGGTKYPWARRGSSGFSPLAARVASPVPISM
jgi:hypothetical protein